MVPSAWTLGAAAIAALVAVPLLSVVASLARPAVDVWVHLWRTQLLELSLNTLVLLVGVGLGTAVLGTALAWLVVGYEFPGRSVFEGGLMLPLAVPAYVIGFAFLGLFDYAGPVQTALRAWLGDGARVPELRSAGGVILLMTLVFYPYVYLLARVAFVEQGAGTLETARSLGRSRLAAFREVTLPLARPAIVAGASLAMMEALADFGTVATFGYRTFTEAIYRVWYGMFDRAAATQLASLLLLFALGLLALERALRGRARFEQSHRRGPGITREQLRGHRAAAATLGCALVLTLAFALPVGQLLVWAAEAAGPFFVPSRFAGVLRNTVVIATTGAAVCAVFALVLAYARRLHPAPGVRVATQFAAMGYALPGSLIAVGILLPTAWADHHLVDALERLLGRPVGLVLTGSILGLVFAYVVRFLAVAFQTLDAGLGRIPSSLDDAARSLGAGVAGVLARVHVPLLRRGLLTALVLVFVDTMKEMPATLLLRPFGFTTLAVEVWERTSESLWAEAAVPALAIVLAGLVPVSLAIRWSGRAGR
ncbi:MAG: iron ABC transporter permease [Candidatus Rokubacteria bacterium]|nr:iron ABC transporter permease [Candidatus Rokubacteria bacterium]